MIQTEQPINAANLEPVLVVTTKDGKLIEAGKPECFKRKKLGDYARQGYEIKTITITQYRETKWVWHWEK
jgi:hypothetical protein